MKEEAIIDEIIEEIGENSEEILRKINKLTNNGMTKRIMVSINGPNGRICIECDVLENKVMAIKGNPIN